MVVCAIFYLCKFKNERVSKKYISFFILLLLAPDPNSDCGSGSTKVIEFKFNPELDQQP
jgi:hypothetical protein